jgi:hypothetical protein
MDREIVKGKVKARWSCPFCQDSYEVHPHAIEVMDLLVVHHPDSKHSQSPVEILTNEADLQEAIDEYMAAPVGDTNRPCDQDPDRRGGVNSREEAPFRLRGFPKGILSPLPPPSSPPQPPQMTTMVMPITYSFEVIGMTEQTE